MPRDLLRELVVQARTPEPDFLNVGNFVAEHAGELAQLLSTTSADLEAYAVLTDDEVVARLRPRLERALARRDEERARRREEDARGAAERLAASACWNDGRAHVDERVLFSRELLAVRRKHTLFIADDFEVGTRRNLIVDARAALAGFLDCGACIDREGVHVTWRGGRGRLGAAHGHAHGRARDHDVDLLRHPAPSAPATPPPRGELTRTTKFTLPTRPNLRSCVD